MMNLLRVNIAGCIANDCIVYIISLNCLPASKYVNDNVDISVMIMYVHHIMFIRIMIYSMISLY